MRNTLFTLLLAAVPVAAMAQAPRYTIELLTAAGNQGADINNSGLVLTNESHEVGGSWVLSAVFLTPRSRVNLGTLGGTQVFGNELNDIGMAVGRSTLAGDATTHAFVYSNGVMQDLGTLGGSNSEAVAVNNAGLVGGNSDIAGGGTRGFLYSAADGMRDIGTLGGAQSRVIDVSESGTVLGEAQTASGEWRYFLYQDGSMRDFGSRGSTTWYGMGPNDEVYGAYDWEEKGLQLLTLHNSSWQPPSGMGRPYDMANGYIVGDHERAVAGVLGTPAGSWPVDELVDHDGEWWVPEASGVNDAGQIVGWGCSAVAGCGTVFLNLVPEPATYGMLGAGLGLIALARRRKAATASRSA
ncbi:PEP-CTERM sorting domain-containing protein [Massilia sp. METH4]|uniref:PEP-CTERM sorting domain-containing protein n=1 Tax=Massilia sp. METH4 TaxID=3123041 RepID=UPI0030D26A48